MLGRRLADLGHRLARCKPGGYLGSWNVNLAAGGTNKERRLTIEPDTIIIYESGGPISSVIRDSDVVTI